MIQMQGMLIAAGVGCLLAFGAGTQVGRGWEASASVKALDKAKAAAGKLIDAKDAEINTLTVEVAQAQAEVAKVNAATAAQYAELKSLLTADQLARAEASVRVEKAAQTAASEARRAGERAMQAREVIQNVADQCARAGVPSDVLRVLNDILDAPSPVVRDGPMPARGGGGR